MHPLHTLASCVLVAFLWGATNPFLRAGAEDAARRASPLGPRPASALGGAVHDAAVVLANWRFFLPFGVNQLGGVAFSLLLGAADLTLAVLLVNSLTLLWTAVTARLVFGERERFTPARVAGAGLVVVGIALCVTSRASIHPDGGAAS